VNSAREKCSSFEAIHSLIYFFIFSYVLKC